MITAILEAAALAAMDLAGIPLRLTSSVIQAIDPRESMVEIDVRYCVRRPKPEGRKDLQQRLAEVLEQVRERMQAKAEAEADDREFE